MADNSNHAERAKMGWPKFDGKYVNYYRFRKDWKRYAVNHAKHFTDEDRVRVFREECVRGGAKSLVDHEIRMEDAWAVLDDHYDRPEVFIQELMEPIKAHKVMRENEPMILASFYNCVKVTMAQAEQVEMLDYTCSLTEISNVLAKLPMAEQNLWGEQRAKVRPGREGQLWPAFILARHKWAQCQSSLQQSLDAREGKFSQGSADAKKKGERPNNNKKGDGSDQQLWLGSRVAVNAVSTAPAEADGLTLRRPGTACPVPECDCQVYLGDCPMFREGDPTSRLEMIEEANLCLKCLCHTAEWDCHSEDPVCSIMEECEDSPHHVLMHEGLANTLTDSQSEEEQ
jgi:hypothetical protein